MLPSRIELLSQESLVKTSDVDHAEWNYRPLLGLLQRTRFKMIVSLLQGVKVDSILEIGYGSGVFFPELKKYCEHISGIDIHSMTAEVSESLKVNGIDAQLVSGSASDMAAFDDNAFDCAVAVSSLEYVVDIDDACQEITRVLRPNGFLVLVTPGQSPILDAGLKLLGGEDADDNYGGRREGLITALHKHFDSQEIRKWPRPSLPWVNVYKALKLTPKN